MAEVLLPSELVYCVSCVAISAGRAEAAVLVGIHVDRLAKQGQVAGRALSAALRALLILGIAMAAMIPMITTTTTSSIRLKALETRLIPAIHRSLLPSYF